MEIFSYKKILEMIYVVLNNFKSLLLLACVAGGIFGTQEVNFLAAEPPRASGKATRNTACQRTWVFCMPPTFITSLTTTDPN